MSCQMSTEGLHIGGEETWIEQVYAVGCRAQFSSIETVGRERGVSS